MSHKLRRNLRCSYQLINLFMDVHGIWVEDFYHHSVCDVRKQCNVHRTLAVKFVKLRDYKERQITGAIMRRSS